MVPESLRRQILESIGAKSVVMKTSQQRRLLAVSENPTTLAQKSICNVQHLARGQRIQDDVLRRWRSYRRVQSCAHGRRLHRNRAEEGPLRDAMPTFSVNIMLVSLLIRHHRDAGLLALNFLLYVRCGACGKHDGLSRKPENPARVIAATERRDEIGMAERELGAISGIWHRCGRRAARGARASVSKINHDLRNLPRRRGFSPRAESS